MTAIALVSGKKRYHINALYPFWDNQNKPKAPTNNKLFEQNKVHA